MKIEKCFTKLIMRSIKKFVAIGHVDTGKSALCGHLLYKCGHIDERNMEKIRVKAIKDGMEKWVWSRVLDIYEEEMQRGKTYQFDVVQFKHQDKIYQLIDTPGHRQFVRSMIEGISEDVNIAVLLISVVDNEFDSSFERGMLKEHLVLAKAVGIEHLIILANKMDAIDWDETKCKKRVRKVTNFLVKNLEWDSSKLYVVPISAFHGNGLMDTRGIPDWYKGKSFIETLSQIPDISRAIVPDSAIIDTLKFRAFIEVLNTGDTIITRGYGAVAHFNKRESEVEFTKVKKGLLKNGDRSECILRFPIKEPVGIGTRIIIRKQGSTVGYGSVTALLDKINA